MNVMSAGRHPARSPPTAGSWLRIGTLARCCCPRSRRWSRDSTAPNPRERGRQSREQFTAGTRRADWPLADGPGERRRSQPYGMAGLDGHVRVSVSAEELLTRQQVPSERESCGGPLRTSWW
jgi:hypothetical protein